MFSWNETKNQLNRKKYGVSFEEAKTVFADDYARLISDPDHSYDEDRYILIGVSRLVRLLVVCHCYRGSNNEIRVITARQADKFEAKQYRDFRHA